MALSDREKKVLEELERGLIGDEEFVQRVSKVASGKSTPMYAVGPDGKRTKIGGSKSTPASRLVAGALIAVVGLSVLIMAVATQIIAIGVVGFLVMLTGLVIGSSKFTNEGLNSSKPNNRESKPKGSGGSFFEDRWNKRFDQ